MKILISLSAFLLVLSLWGCSHKGAGSSSEVSCASGIKALGQKPGDEERKICTDASKTVAK